MKHLLTEHTRSGGGFGSKIVTTMKNKDRETKKRDLCRCKPFFGMKNYHCIKCGKPFQNYHDAKEAPKYPQGYIMIGEDDQLYMKVGERWWQLKEGMVFNFGDAITEMLNRLSKIVKLK
jgi:hypothetical protein